MQRVDTKRSLVETRVFLKKSIEIINVIIRKVCIGLLIKTRLNLKLSLKFKKK